MKDISVRAAPKTEILWGISQKCEPEITDPDQSINGPQVGFDGKTASCSMAAGNHKPAWTMDRFERPAVDRITQIRLEIGFYVSAWDNQNVLVIQGSNNAGRTWSDLERYDQTNPPPVKLDYLQVDTGALFADQVSLRKAQVRLVYLNRAPGEASSLLYLDGMRFVGIGENALPTPTLTETNSPSSTISPSSPTDTPTGDIGSMFTPTATIVQPTAVETATFTSTATVRLTPISITQTPAGRLPGTYFPTLMATTVMTSTPQPTPSPQPIPDAIPRGQVLWVVNQSCSFPIDHPENSLDQKFNDQMASCSGGYAGQQADWKFTDFQSTSFTHIDDIYLELRVAVNGWENDRLDLEVFDGEQWQQIDRFDSDHTLPPSGIVNLSYSLIKWLPSPDRVNQAKVRLVGIQANQTVDLIKVSVDSLRMIVSGGTASIQAVGPIPTPSSLNLASVNTAVNGDPHGDFSVTTDSCAACHRAHTGQGPSLRENWPEEGLCFGCHGVAGPGTSVQPAFSNNLNTATGYYSHPVNGTNNVHSLGEMGGGHFGGSNRHIECEDCHEPHQTGRGSASAPAIQAEMTGNSGVDPLWTAAGAPASFAWLTTATREYQVCFKCHSSYTTLPAYSPDGWNGSAIIANGLRKLTSGNSQQILDSRDLAKEFNPYQASYHPVAAQGRNTSIPSGSFVNGWTQASLVYCSDCHSNAAPASGGTGPHGSPLLHLLTGSSNYSTVVQNHAQRVPSTQICFTCHNYATYVTGQNQASNFPYHEKHMDNDWGTTCYTCHDSHGSEQLHLINFDASVVTFPTNRNSQTAWYYDPVSQTAGCYLSCHGKTHNPETYRP